MRTGIYHEARLLTAGEWGRLLRMLDDMRGSLEAAIDVGLFSRRRSYLLDAVLVLQEQIGELAREATERERTAA
jgi:O-succinylbenzoate synthase